MTALIILFVLMVAFQIKHFIIDFVFQTDEMVKGKGIYGNADGILHSLQHALGTLIIALIFTPSIAFVLSFLDFITHYHIDYVKMKYGNRDIKQKQFWVQLGLDQFAHQVTYALIIFLMLV